MNRLIVTLTLTLTTSCTTVTGISLATQATTGKSLADHTLSLVSGNDCNSIKYAVGEQDYLCEQARTASTSYVRDRFGR
jgi:hypothetical protein